MIGTTNSVNVKINDTVSALTNNLNSEINARQTADTTLQSNINAVSSVANSKRGQGTATVSSLNVDTLSFNTWYHEDVWRWVTFKCRNKQNLSIRMSWGADTSDYSTNWFHVYSNWDNNNGDGMATATFLVPAGHYWYAEYNANRDSDNINRVSRYNMTLA